MASTSDRVRGEEVRFANDVKKTGERSTEELKFSEEDIERADKRELTLREATVGSSSGSNSRHLHDPSSTSLPKSKSSVLQSLGVTIHFYKLTMVAHRYRGLCKRTTKRILKGVTGVVHRGTMTALMGPSGCGKTCCLEALADRSHAEMSGHILVDGEDRDDSFHHRIGYVKQDDQLMGVLTVRENIAFSAELRLPTSLGRAEKKRRVDDTIDLLSLWKCHNTRIGTNLLRGVSGGERKRTSIGMELVVDPIVLFLDEPTSGLDSHTAHSVVSILSDLAKDGKTVMLSIHQPRWSTFQLFDGLIVLGEGEVVYQGATRGVLEYFGRQNYVCEPYNNPADFVLDVCSHAIAELKKQQSMGGTLTVEEGGGLAKAWLESPEYKAIFDDCEQAVLAADSHSLTSTLPQHGGGQPASHSKHHHHGRRSGYPTSCLHQIRVLSKRTILAVFRNPEASIMQILAFILSALIVGTFYKGRLTDGASGLEDRVGAMFVISYMVIFGQLTSIELFIQERPLFIHEKCSGFYRSIAYFISKVCCEILPTRLVPTLFYALISAFMIGLRTDVKHFCLYWLTLSVTNMASTSLCLMVSAMVPVYSMGFLIAALFNVFFMISSGFLLDTYSMPPGLLPFKYMSIFRYNLNMLLTLDLHGRKFNCKTHYASGHTTLCLDSGDEYLQAKNIHPEDMWDNIIALAVMSPCYLFVAYLILLRLKDGR